MKISLNQNPLFFIEDGKFKAQIKQGKDLLECLIEKKTSFYKQKLSFWEKTQKLLKTLFNREPKWVSISIKNGSKIEEAYLLKSVFEKQEFKQIVKKALKKKEKVEAKKAQKATVTNSKSQTTSPVEKKETKAKPKVAVAPMIYTLDKVKIEKSNSYDALRQIALKYLKLAQDSHDFHILDTILQRLEELKIDPFGKHEKEILHTLFIKFQNAEIPKIHLNLKQIKEAMTPQQKQEILKIALKLPQDASLKMIHNAYARIVKELSLSKETSKSISMQHLKDLFEANSDQKSQTA